MLHVDDKPETLHIYVVKDEAPKPQLFPIVLAVLALVILVALAVVVPYQQPVMMLTIRVPAVLLHMKTFTAHAAIIPTGVKVYPATTARGMLTITNGSVISQTIPQGFRLGNVITDSSVFVPAGSANGYGWAQVQAHSVMAGQSGNLPAYAINSVIGSSVYIRNLTAFHGGRDSYSVTFVIDKDRSAAIANARDSLLRISSGLHYPCFEAVSVSEVSVRVSWRCQYVTFSLPSYMHVSSVRIIGTNLVIAVTFTPRPVRVGLK